MDINEVSLEHLKKCFVSCRNLNIKRVVAAMSFRTKSIEFIRHFLLCTDRKLVIPADDSLEVVLEYDKGKVAVKEIYLDHVNFLFLKVADEKNEIHTCHVDAITDDSLADVVVHVQGVIGFPISDIEDMI